MKRNKSPNPIVLAIVGLALVSTLLYLRGERWLRDLLLYLSSASWAREIVTGLPIARRVASRFVAGETIPAALATTQELNAAGFRVTLDFLGESVTSAEEAKQARDEILQLLRAIHDIGVSANVSVKPTQLGLGIAESLAQENLRALLKKAAEYDNWLRLDMEDSPHIDKTLKLYRQLRFEEAFENVGIVIQSYLYRSAADVNELCQTGARVRLVKGAYAEPAHLAFPNKQDTDANFITLMHQMLTPAARAAGTWLAVATHDEAMIDAAIAELEAQGLAPDTIEFQMLYGIRRDLQTSLRDAGYPVRIYVPYGQAWYPYFTRRLAERPANLWFFLSNLFAT